MKSACLERLNPGAEARIWAHPSTPLEVAQDRLVAMMAAVMHVAVRVRSQHPFADRRKPNWRLTDVSPQISGD